MKYLFEKYTLSVCILFFVLLIFSTTSKAQINQNEITVRKIWSNNYYNSFTSLVYFNNTFYCAFRQGVTHSGRYGHGDIRIIKSKDGKTWDSVTVLHKEGYDLRDPKLSITPDKRIMVIMGGSVYQDRLLKKRLTHVSFSDDNGQNFSNPQPINVPNSIKTDNDWLWQVTWHGKTGYGVLKQLSKDHQMDTMYTKDQNSVEAKLLRTQTISKISLLKTKNGIDYKIITTIDEKEIGDFASESTVRVTSNGEMFMMVRRHENGFWGRSKSPYKQWQWTNAGMRLDGPDFISFNDSLFIAGTRVHDEGARTGIFLVNRSGKFKQILELPSGGDTSYPGFVFINDKIYVSYYSSHEGSASIYLAEIPVSIAENFKTDSNLTNVKTEDLYNNFEESMPKFIVDPFWPKPLPNNWLVGQVTGVATDSNDHIWIIHRPKRLGEDEALPTLSSKELPYIPAPPVIEFDPEGNVVQAWGGPSDEFSWPQYEHGIFIDYEKNVWISGAGEKDNQVLKFTSDGKFLLQIGKFEETGGSNDTELLGRPTNMNVDSLTNEVYISDGYTNHRIIVFDAVTGQYKRHWGAYGNKPKDIMVEQLDTIKSPPQQFGNIKGNAVHSIEISKDNKVYVCDRSNNRIQVFQKNGKFIREKFIASETSGLGSTWDLAFSHDPQQEFIYVADGTNQCVWILERQNMEIIGKFGRIGRNAGQFIWIHNLAVDSKGNIYTTEVRTGKRIQKFKLQKPINETISD